MLVDVSNFTATTNHFFLKATPAGREAFLEGWNLFRNRYIQLLSSHGVAPAYPANRMGDGFLTLIYGEVLLTSRVIHLVWRLNRFLDDLAASLRPYLPVRHAGLSQLKVAVVFDPLVHELVVPVRLLGNKSIDPKDYVSPHINLLARMLTWFEKGFAANSFLVPHAGPEFPEMYAPGRRSVALEADLGRRMKGFSSHAIRQFLPGGMDLITIGRCHFV